MEININYKNEFLSLGKLTDFIAFSIIYFTDNYKKIFSKIILPQIFSILASVFLFVALDGELNLTFIISKEGKIWIGFTIFLILVNVFNSIYQSIKLVMLQSLDLRNLKFKLKIFALTTIRFIILLTLIITYFYDELFVINLFVFMVLNLYFYFHLFTQSNRLVYNKNMQQTFLEKLNLHINAFILVVLNRLLLIFIPFIVTFSIFIVYEFVRILMTGKIFFFITDRIDELAILFLLFLILLLIMNPFQYLSLMNFHKYYYISYQKKISENLE